MQAEVGGAPGDHNNPCLQQARRQEVVGIFLTTFILTNYQACGKHLHGLVVWNDTQLKIFGKLSRSAFTLEARGSFPFHFRYILCLFSYQIHWINE